MKSKLAKKLAYIGLPAATLVAVAGVAAAPASASEAIDVSCAASGEVSISPGLGLTAAPQSYTGSGTLSGCEGTVLGEDVAGTGTFRIINGSSESAWLGSGGGEAKSVFLLDLESGGKVAIPGNFTFTRTGGSISLEGSGLLRGQEVDFSGSGSFTARTPVPVTLGELNTSVNIG